MIFDPVEDRQMRDLVHYKQAGHIRLRPLSLNIPLVSLINEDWDWVPFVGGFVYSFAAFALRLYSLWTLKRPLVIGTNMRRWLLANSVLSTGRL